MLRLDQMLTLLQGRIPSARRWTTCLATATLRESLTRYKYDVVHADSINFIYYRDELAGIPTVLSLNDSVSRICFGMSRSNYSWGQRLFLRQLAHTVLREEGRMLPRFEATHVVSEVEAEWLKCRAALSNVVVIKPSVDASYLTLGDLCSDGASVPVLFAVGRLDVPFIREPLLLFLKRYWAKLGRKWPGIRFTILGPGSSIGVKRELKSYEGVEHLEWVSEFQHFLSAGRIAIFLDGGGTGIKTRVLQAMAAKKAVIGTPYAFEGFNVCDSVHGFVVNGNDACFNRINECLASSALVERLGGAARALARDEHGPEVIGRQWEALYERLAGPESHDIKE